MFQIDFNHPLHVYFVGIGGISMSGLAQILAREGFTVSGSDRSESPITQNLQASGIRVLIGQRRETLPTTLISSSLQRPSIRTIRSMPPSWKRESLT